MADHASRTSSDEKKTMDEMPLEDQILTPGLMKDLADRRTSLVSREGEIINASGHRDQLQRHYSLLSICGLALNIDSGSYTRWSFTGCLYTVPEVNALTLGFQHGSPLVAVSRSRS
jgi:hypothetical protein